MSDTPRTDAAVQAYYDTGQSFSVVEPELSRQLERELNEANERIEELEAERGKSVETMINMGCEIGEAKQQAIDFLKAWVESDADRLRLRAVLQSIDLSPCNGGSCQVATDADDYIQAALATTSAPPPVVAKADADALATILVSILSARSGPHGWVVGNLSLYAKQAEEALKTYHAKYPKP
jgi:hypothetical protein